MEKKYVIFGAGKWGYQAVYEYGKENILYIIDNNCGSQGKNIEGIPVVNFDYYVNDDRKPHILVAIK